MRNRNKKEEQPEFMICSSCIAISVLQILFKMWLDHRNKFNPNYAEAEIDEIYDKLINSDKVDNDFPYEEFVRLIKPSKRARWKDRFGRLGDSGE